MVVKRFLIGTALGAVAALVSHAFGLDILVAVLIGLGVAAVIWFRFYRILDEVGLDFD